MQLNPFEYLSEQRVVFDWNPVKSISHSFFSILITNKYETYHKIKVISYYLSLYQSFLWVDVHTYSNPLIG